MKLKPVVKSIETAMDRIMAEDGRDDKRYTHNQVKDLLQKALSEGILDYVDQENDIVDKH